MFLFFINSSLRTEEGALRSDEEVGDGWKKLKSRNRYHLKWPWLTLGQDAHQVNYLNPGSWWSWWWSSTKREIINEIVLAFFWQINGPSGFYWQDPMIIMSTFWNDLRWWNSDLIEVRIQVGWRRQVLGHNRSSWWVNCPSGGIWWIVRDPKLPRICCRLGNNLDNQWSRSRWSRSMMIVAKWLWSRWCLLLTRAEPRCYGAQPPWVWRQTVSTEVSWFSTNPEFSPPPLLS